MRASSLLVAFSAAAAVLAATPTDDAAATCVSSTASSTNTTTWTIGYVEVGAPVTGTGYDIDPSFVAEYGFNNTMVRRALLLSKFPSVETGWRMATYPKSID